MKRKARATHEVVRVAMPATFLVDSSKHACRYETRDGLPLAPGYYFALWPETARTRSYDLDVRYFGPFATEQEALLVQRCAVFLGIAAAIPNARPAAELDKEQFLTPLVRGAYVELLSTAHRSARSGISRAPRSRTVSGQPKRSDQQAESSR